MKDIGHFIAGRQVEHESGGFGAVFNPATGEQSGRVGMGGTAEVDAAVEAAQRAQPAWAETPLLRRMRVMFKLKELIEQNTDRVARLVTEEHGKTLKDAKGSVTRGLEVVEFACGLPQLMKGDFSHQVGGGVDLVSVRHPVGI